MGRRQIWQLNRSVDEIWEEFLIALLIGAAFMLA